MTFVLMLDMGFGAGAASGGAALSGSRLVLLGVGAVLLLLIGV